MDWLIDALGSFWGVICDFFSNIPNMLGDLLINAWNFLSEGVVNVIAYFLDSLGLSVQIPMNVFESLNDLTRSIGYILPIPALLPIPTFYLAFYVARIIFSIYSLIASTVIRKVNVGGGGGK